MLTVNPAEHSDTETLPANPVLAEHNNTEAIQPEILPVYHLHVGYNSNGEMYDELTNEGEFVNIHDVNDDIFNEVIQELERDADIQQLLNEIEIQPLPEPADIDEGIDLNIENEDDDFDFLYDF